MTQPGVEGDWSVKDIIAHVAWHEREMLGLLRTRVLAGSLLWDLPTDARNAAIYAANCDRPLDEIVDEETQVFGDLMDLCEALTDADLADPRLYREMPGDWVPGEILAQNTYEHYAQHISPIQAWLAAHA